MRDPSEKVVVAYLSPSMLHAAFHRSMVKLLAHDATLHKRIVSGGGDLHVQAGGNISGPRNNLVRAFLEFGRAEWMWMVDSDMTFQPDTVERLLEHADPDSAPIVGGLCFGFNDAQQIQPTLYEMVDEDGELPRVGRYLEWHPDAMMRVCATGAACLLIHRSVFERMRDVQLPDRDRPGFSDAYPWFQETEYRGGPVGEDITFCWRARDLGIPIYVNTGVQLGHVKDRELNADVYLAQRAAELAATDA